MIISCSSDSENNEDPNSSNCQFEDKALAGDILSASFQLTQGTSSYYDNDDEYQIFLFGADELITPDPCDIIGVQGTQITLFVSNKTGEGNSPATLYNASTMDFKTASACYSVEEITSSTISGQLTIEDADNGNAVSGNWEVIICD